MKINNKAFTLIELLAVIVILAIIALIATPIVLNIINDSKESAQLRSAEMYLKGVETSVATATINNKKVTDGTYPITKDGDICLVELTNTKTCSDEEKKLVVEMNGETPESGTLTILNGKVTDIELTYSNGKTIVKNNGKLVYGTEDDEKIEYTAYVVGDTVTIGTENFYVIADSDETQEKVILLTKDNIDTKNLVQSTSANAIAFSETNYWEDNFISLPYDLREIGEPDESHYAAKAAYDYGAKYGALGRLMTYEEYNLLEDGYEVILHENGNEQISYYWLGFASSTYAVPVVFTNIGGYGGNDYMFTGCVRPVVEISKSLITN